MAATSEKLSNATVIELSDIKTKEEFKKWLKQYHEETGQKFRVKWSSTGDTTCILYRANFVCVHNTLPETSGAKTSSKKHTGCPVQLKVRIRSANATSDAVCKVEIHGTHNHPLKVTDALNFSRVSNVTRESFLKLFRDGHSPVEALQVHKQDLMDKYGDEYLRYVTDRSQCPDLNWIYTLFTTEFKKRSVVSKDDKFLAAAYSYVKKLRRGGHKVEMGMVDRDFFVVVVTDLAERVHLLEVSGQFVFFNSLGVTDVEKKSKVFLMLTNSIIGGLPLGFFILSNESEKLMIEALLVFKALLPCDAFGGRGPTGPHVFVTDDCTAVQDALRTAFPSSSLLLGVFHVLEVTWRWLWNAQHKIKREDRIKLFKNMSSLIYCRTASELELCYQSCVSDKVAKQHQTYISHLKKLFANLNLWALSLHEEQQLNATGLDAELHVLKDRVFFQAKVFSVDRMMDFIVNNLNIYYQRKIVYVITDQHEEFLEATYNSLKPVDLSMAEAGGGLYEVMSCTDNVSHLVAFFLGRCECPCGSFGSPCRHQHAVAVNLNENSASAFLPDSEDRKLLCWTATGSFSEDTDSFRKLISVGSQGNNLQIANSVPEVANEIVVEMELDRSMNADYETSTGNYGDPDVGSNVVRAKSMLSDITSTIAKHLQNADESFYKSFLKFHAVFRAAASTKAATQDFFRSYEGTTNVNNKTFIIYPSPVSTVNFALPSGKLPIPPISRKKKEAVPDETPRKHSLTAEHGYAAPPKRKK